MDVLTAVDLEQLAAIRGRFCVSIYTPTHPAWPESRPDRPSFEGQLTEAAGQLEALGVGRVEAGAMLAPALRLADDPAFWRAQSQGLAVFVGPAFFRSWRLPLRVEAMVNVAQRFTVRPLLAVLQGDIRYFVLALTQEDVRLLRCTRETAVEVALPEHPRSVAQATGFDEPQRGFTFHAGTPLGQGTQRAPTIHTIGIATHDTKEDILEYCRAIDRRLEPLLRDGQAPLVLAGVEFITSIYRSANTYPRLLEGVVAGATGRLSADDLRRRAWPLVEAQQRRAAAEALARSRQSMGTGSASADLVRILVAASAGQVGTLLVADVRPVWGRFDPPAPPAVHPRQESGDEDLIDAAAVHTLAHRGSVFVLPPDQMPVQSPAAALFRYEIPG